MSIGVCGVIHLIGHIFMMQMPSISGFDSGSSITFRMSSFILIKFNTFDSGISGVIQSSFTFRMSPEIHSF